MKVLSLFDGISCARVALDRAGIAVETYSACEIDKHAIKVSETNYPDIVRLGDVREVKGFPVDLLIGGSPCQDLSIAKKGRKGLDGERSGLFWEYVRIWKECKPRWFILENVASMPKADRDIITREMGVEPVLINAALVSAQCRKRLFWTNIPFKMPEDRGIALKDILQAEVDERMIVKGTLTKTAQTGRNATKKLGYVGENDHQAKRVYDADGKLPALNAVCNSMVKVGYIGEGEQYGQGGQAHRVYSPDGKTPALSSFAPLVKLGHLGNTDSQGNRVYDADGKSCTLSANGGGLGAKTGLYQTEGVIRKLTPVECERLQSLPDGYTAGIALTNRYKCLGNAFNVEVIRAILAGVVAQELP
jgi:DNA-cytosine methyltransferase